jgi:hypothetical protein
MPAYDRSRATDYEEIDRWERGIGWIAHPDEDGQRASHATVGDDGVWVIDPVDAPGIDDLVAEFGDVAGVAVLSNYHARDAGAVATRHDVAVHVPHWMGRVVERVDAPVTVFDEGFGDAGFRVHRFEPLGLWQEAVAYREADGTLYVPDMLSTAPGYVVGDERLGLVMPHRFFPPTELSDFDPERILLGHGRGVFVDASGALAEALDSPYRRSPWALAGLFAVNVRLLVSAMWE